MDTFADQLSKAIGTAVVVCCIVALAIVGFFFALGAMCGQGSGGCP